MTDPVDPRDEGALDPVRFSAPGVEALEASVRRLMEESEQQARLLDSLAAGPEAVGMPYGLPAGLMAGMPASASEPRFILTLDGAAYEAELDALTDWVHDFLLPTYGAEVSTASPWCLEWQEHTGVVGWLHSLWMAYRQHIEPDAGSAGPAVWHRDFLTHTMAAIRAPGGPLSACTTSLERPAHRILPSPHPLPERPGEPDGSEGRGVV